MNDEPNPLLTLVALGLVAFGAFQATGGKLPFNPPGPKPAPVDVPAPPADLQAIVAPVATQAKQVGADAALAAPLYLSLAQALEADSGLLKTTDSLRQLGMRAGGLLFSAQGWKGKYPEMGKAIDAALIEAIGNDNKTLDPALRQRAAAAWRAIAWALSGGS